MSLFPNVIFSLLLLTLLNLLLKRYLPKFALSQGELLVIYTMMCLASALCGTDMLQVLIPIMSYAFWFATPENEWSILFHKYIPKWLSVDDKGVLIGYYEGSSSFFTAGQIKAWLMPVIAWFGFICTLFFVMLCISVIVRRQWTEREKLTYPIIQLPLEMTRDGGASSFFKNKLLWIGFAIAGGINIINGLHFLHPAIPSLSIRYNLQSLFTEKPWNAIGRTPIYFFPFVVGLGFLVASDLLFSWWVFYLFWKAENILGSMAGWRSLPGFPYQTEQLIGVWFGLFIFAVLATRRHLKVVFKVAFGIGKKGGQEFDDSSEPIPYRTAIFGIIIGMVLLTLFSCQAGMSLWVSVLFFGIYFALSMTIARIRAELGPPAHGFHSRGPDEFLQKVFGTRRLGAANLTIFSFFYWFNRAYRGQPMAHTLEGFKIAERTKTSGGKFFFAMMLATAVGTLATFCIHLHLSYKFGASTRIMGYSAAFGAESFWRLERWLSHPAQTDYLAVSFMGMGLISALFIMLMRVRFFWWPLHAAGLAVTGAWTTDHMWFSIFLAWVAKWTILKYGGLKTYRHAVPFFIGLVLGEYVVGSLWAIIGMALGIPTFNFCRFD